MELMETLQFYRKRQGLSQVELAEALDVSRQTISKWETGAALPSAENLLALSKLYGVPADALLNGVEIEEKLLPAGAELFTVPPPAPELTVLSRKKLVLQMLAVTLLCDLFLFFMDISYLGSGGDRAFNFFGFITRILACCGIGLCFAWRDRDYPVQRRTALLLSAAALAAGLYAFLMPIPLLWRLYDLVGGDRVETPFPTDPGRWFLAWTLCDEWVFSSHMCLIAAFQLGRLRFARKKKACIPKPQAVSQR